MTGTLINAAAIIAGSALGMLIHSRLPEKIIDIVFQAIGLFTLVLGISMSLESGSLIIAVISVAAGSALGQWIDIDKYLRRLSDSLQRTGRRKSTGDGPAGTGENRFTEGFVTASMLFCVGSMSILGAIEEGVGDTPNLLFTKSIMDAISSVALASSFGIAIMFSSLPVLVYQGGLTLFAAFLSNYMNAAVIADITCVGGILLAGLGITILKIKEIKVVNMLPALVIAAVISIIMQAAS